MSGTSNPTRTTHSRSWPDEVLRLVHGRRRRRLRRGPGRGVRLPRAQRRRQDVDDADDRHRLAGDRREADRLRARPGPARCADPGAPRSRPSGGHPRQRAERPREPADLRSLLRPVVGRVAAAGRGAARVRPADRAIGRQGRAAVGRHEAPPGHRPIADQRAVAAAPRRADDRARSAGPPPAVGSAVPAQAARRDAVPDDPLHGRGRAAVRPAGGHGPGPHRRRGIAPRAHRPVRHQRSAGAALPRGPKGRPTIPSSSTASSRAWRSGSSSSRIASWSTRRTARPRPPRRTSGGSGRRASSSGAAPSRTSSSASPAAAWSSDDDRRPAPRPTRGHRLSPLAAHPRARPAGLPARLAQLPAVRAVAAVPLSRGHGHRPGAVREPQRRRCRAACRTSTTSPRRCS